MDLASRFLRTALGFQRAGLAVDLARAIHDGVGLGDAGALVLELSEVTPQRLARRTDVAVGLGLPPELRATDLPRFALGFVVHRNVRGDLLLLN